MLNVRFILKLGDYKDTSLTMNFNLLTRFESSVFQGTLEEMMTGSGNIYILDSILK